MVVPYERGAEVEEHNKSSQSSTFLTRNVRGSKYIFVLFSLSVIIELFIQHLI